MDLHNCQVCKLLLPYRINWKHKGLPFSTPVSHSFQTSLLSPIKHIIDSDYLMYGIPHTYTASLKARIVRFVREPTAAALVERVRGEKGLTGGNLYLKNSFQRK